MQTAQHKKKHINKNKIDLKVKRIQKPAQPNQNKKVFQNRVKKNEKPEKHEKHEKQPAEEKFVTSSNKVEELYQKAKGLYEQVLIRVI